MIFDIKKQTCVFSERSKKGSFLISYFLFCLQNSFFLLHCLWLLSGATIVIFPKLFTLWRESRKEVREKMVEGENFRRKVARGNYRTRLKQRRLTGELQKWSKSNSENATFSFLTISKLTFLCSCFLTFCFTMNSWTDLERQFDCCFAQR